MAGGRCSRGTPAMTRTRCWGGGGQGVQGGKTRCISIKRHACYHPDKVLGGRKRGLRPGREGRDGVNRRVRCLRGVCTTPPSRYCSRPPPQLLPPSSTSPLPSPLRTWWFPPSRGLPTTMPPPSSATHPSSVTSCFFSRCVWLPPLLHMRSCPPPVCVCLPVLRNPPPPAGPCGFDTPFLTRSDTPPLFFQGDAGERRQPNYSRGVRQRLHK